LGRVSRWHRTLLQAYNDQRLAFSRNPIYVAFPFVLLGEFLVFPNWILLIYMVAGIWLSHRQVQREEEFLRKHYGRKWSDYC
jgi:protein-S-isoprenylcysteine O-methyltransferase Ste14